MATATSYWNRKLGLPTRSKYGAVPAIVNGWRFDSKREAKRYGELLLLGLAGEIRDLELQPRFPLNVHDVVIGHYVSDFRYAERVNGIWRDVVEDVKSSATVLPIYRWKIKHLRAQYGIEVRETR